MYRTSAGRLLVAGAFAALALCALAYVFRPIHARDLPQDARTLVVLDRTGAPLCTVLGRDDRHTAAVPFERMSPWLAPAMLAAEDHRFTEHGALDPVATARALLQALAHHRAPGGASTIPMQLARTLAPLPSGPLGQIQETILAQRLENGMSAAEVFTAYANRVPMGSNLYGVEAAARTYFGSSAESLDLAQSAALAALPNAPAELDPYRHRARWLARQRAIIARLQTLGWIDAQTARRAGAEDLALVTPGAGIVAAAHLCFFAAAHTAPEVSRVRTTIDLELQRFVERQVRDVVGSLRERNVHQAAALVVDNRTAQVLAYAGSVAYGDTAGGRNDGVQALRQPGSALKPFLYELALERRAIRPFTILPDVPAAYAIPGARLYEPTDYSMRFLGPVRVRVALADSLNVPAVRVLERTGVPVFLDRLHDLGFHHLDRDADYYGLGLTLGGGEVSLFEVARAYLALARGGLAPPLVTAFGNDDAPAPEISRDPAWALVTDMLADSHARAAAFGTNSILGLPFPAAVKTGTSSDFRDTWTAGFTRDYTVAVWVGNFDGSPMRGVSGVSGAGPLWSRIMRHLHERSDPPAFDPPAGSVRRAICTTQARLADPSAHCVAAFEWLAPDDLAELARVPSHPLRAAAEYDAWLARQPPAARTHAGARILFPQDGDVFVASMRTQRIRVEIATRDPRSARLRLDGRPLSLRDDAYIVTLVRGTHEITVHATDGDGRARFFVVPHGPAARVGFTFARRSR